MALPGVPDAASQPDFAMGYTTAAIYAVALPRPRLTTILMVVQVMFSELVEKSRMDAGDISQRAAQRNIPGHMRPAWRLKSPPS